MTASIMITLLHLRDTSSEDLQYAFILLSPTTDSGSHLLALDYDLELIPDYNLVELFAISS